MDTGNTVQTPGYRVVSIAGWKEAIADFATADWPLIATGRPGVGKTAGFVQAAVAAGVKHAITHPAIRDRVDYAGLPIAYREGGESHAEFVPWGELRSWAAASEPTWVLWDDLGQAERETQGPAMQAWGERQVGEVVISPHIRWFGATNTAEHRAGVSRLIEPFGNRAAFVRVEVDADATIDHLIEQGCSPMLSGFLERFPHWLTTWEPSQDGYSPTATPRTIQAGDQFWSREDHSRVRRLRNLAATVGDAYATAFDAYEEVGRLAPSPSEILEDPASASVPDAGHDHAGSILFACISHLAVIADEANYGALMTYVDRLPAEYRHAFVAESVKRNADVRRAHAYRQFMATEGVSLARLS